MMMTIKSYFYTGKKKFPLLGNDSK